MKKTYFFGWTNIKRFITELIKIYSSQQSFFSKKRIESSIAFIIGEWGMIYFLMHTLNSLNAGDFAIWAGVQFAVAGYIIRYIQKEKGAVNTNEEVPDLTGTDTGTENTTTTTK